MSNHDIVVHRQLSNFREPPPGLERLVSLLEAVEFQLELAIYLFSCPQLASAVLRGSGLSGGGLGSGWSQRIRI